MLKVAMLAAVLTAPAPGLAAGTTPVEAPDCHGPAGWLAPACATDPTAPAADPDVFAAPAPPAVDWAPLHAGLAFKEAATEPAPTLSAMPDVGPRHRLIPALFALGALVLLLRQRPL